MNNAPPSIDDTAALMRALSIAVGPGSVLHAGGATPDLVQRLLTGGIDAFGAADSAEVVLAGHVAAPGRFVQGLPVNLPYADERFDAVVCSDGLEALSIEQASQVLAELTRVSRRTVLLRVNTAPARPRAFWEGVAFQVGLRKHARYLAVAPYEELEYEPTRVTIVLEKIPASALHRYPIQGLAAERDLHMDMLRETGRRSDAHVVRYQMAARLVRPGDRVLDAACGLGYGGHVLRHNSMAQSIRGVDLSATAIAYARENFTDQSESIAYEAGDLPSALATVPDAGIDFIASFETLEHLDDPASLLREFHRILTPGGRVVLSVPNLWVDETGHDPNPHHRQVYNWSRFKADISQWFLIDETWAQVASQQRVTMGDAWEPGVRRFRRFDAASGQLPPTEWWVIVGMKSPIDAASAYRETVFANVAKANSPVAHFGQHYDNPWLAHALVHVGYRLRDRAELKNVARRVLDGSRAESADRGAALCVLAYLALAQSDQPWPDSLLKQIDAYQLVASDNPHVLRWQISLAFVQGRMAMARGDFLAALLHFECCMKTDSLRFSPHLGTKTCEAAYLAGRLSIALHAPENAAKFWRAGVDFGERLTSTHWTDVLVNPEFPNLFDHGDGAREFVLALDFVTRCANGLHLLQRAKAGIPVDWRLLDGSFQHLAQALQADLQASQAAVRVLNIEVDEARAELRRRTRDCESAVSGLMDRTRELAIERDELLKRTNELDQARAELVSRTGELDVVRAELQGRTREVDQARADLVARTKELDIARRIRR